MRTIFGRRLRLGDYRIKARIYCGFGVVLAVAALLAASGAWQFSRVGRQIDRLAGAAEDVTRNLEVTRIAEALRRIGLQYKTMGDEAAVAEFAEEAGHAALLLDAAAKAAHDEAQQIYQ